MNTKKYLEAIASDNAMDARSLRFPDCDIEPEKIRNVIPSGSTYKIRNDEFYWGAVRVFPSYIITGGNILIEKSKCEMIADDLRKMTALIG